MEPLSDDSCDVLGSRCVLNGKMTKKRPSKGPSSDRRVGPDDVDGQDINPKLVGKKGENAYQELLNPFLGSTTVVSTPIILSNNSDHT